jgi:regulator of sigma E protease
MDALTDLLSLLASNIWIYGGSFLLVLSILILVHEWGHYAAARLCGVRVDEFSLGMGREMFGFRSKSGTRWKVCLLPIGGYVKMFGDTDPAGAGKTDQVRDGTDALARPMTDDERKQAFFSKSILQRSFIVFAGPGINFLFAVLLLAGLFMTQGREIIPATITGVQVGSPSERAGFLPGDQVLTMDGETIESFDHMRRKVMIALDTPIEVTLLRGSDTIQKTITPKRMEGEDRFGFKHERGYIGTLGPSYGLDLKAIVKVDGVSTDKNPDNVRTLILRKIGNGPFRIATADVDGMDEVVVNPSKKANEGMRDPNAKTYNALVLTSPDSVIYKKYAPVQAVGEAVFQTYQISVDSLKALGQIVMGTRSPTELGGVIRIGTVAGDMAQAGLIAFISFTALLSINLGLINLFPIPMLDGGHLTFYAIEAIRGGRPIPERAQEYAFRFGLVVLVFLMVFSNLNDILQLIL